MLGSRYKAKLEKKHGKNNLELLKIEMQGREIWRIKDKRSGEESLGTHSMQSDIFMRLQ